MVWPISALNPPEFLDRLKSSPGVGNAPLREKHGRNKLRFETKFLLFGKSPKYLEFVLKEFER